MCADEPTAFADTVSSPFSMGMPLGTQPYACVRAVLSP